MKLNEKTAIVTGGAMGIGLATAKRLISSGVTVTLWDIDKPALAQAVKELKAAGGKAFGQVCDVTDKKKVAQAAKQAVKDMGRVETSSSTTRAMSAAAISWTCSPKNGNGPSTSTSPP